MNDAKTLTASASTNQPEPARQLNRAERRRRARADRKAAKRPGAATPEVRQMFVPCPACEAPIRLTGTATQLQRIEHPQPPCAAACNEDPEARAAFLRSVLHAVKKRGRRKLA